MALRRSRVRISLGPLRSVFRDAFLINTHHSAAAPRGGFAPFGRLGAASACHREVKRSNLSGSTKKRPNRAFFI